MISILNFNPLDKSVKIDSPRTVQAMKQLGYCMQTLYQLSFEDVKRISLEIGYHHLNKDDIHKIFQEVEANRLTKIQ